MADFQPAFDFMLPHEGGLCNDACDEGGQTKYGISKRSYPDLDIAGLTLADAQAIYRRDWWRYDAIRHQRIANKVFDLAINVGFRAAHKILQRAVNDSGGAIGVDGEFGPVTLAAVNRCCPVELLEAMRTRAAAYYREIVLARPQNQKFLKGWLKRAAA